MQIYKHEVLVKATGAAMANLKQGLRPLHAYIDQIYIHTGGRSLSAKNCLHEGTHDPLKKLQLTAATPIPCSAGDLHAGTLGYASLRIATYAVLPRNVCLSMYVYSCPYPTHRWRPGLPNAQ